MQEIDIVILYVDGDDPEWLKEFNKYNFKPKEGDGNKLVRYGADDSFKYLFRSIDLYCPWVRKVHLVVMMDSQVPKWIDREKVNIVYHRDFIPEKHLPLFSSSCIEMYLWNIPDLAEHFLYFNDDMFFNSNVSPSDYFTENGKIRFNLQKNCYKNSNILNAAYMTTFMNSAKLAMHDTDIEIFGFDGFLHPLHHIKPSLRSNIEFVYNKYKQQIENSISKFREEYNICQYLFTIYDVTHGFAEKSKRQSAYIRNITRLHKRLKTILNNKIIQEICINDIPVTTIKDKKNAIGLLKEKFPHKSKYEK